MPSNGSAYARLCDEDTERDLLGCLLVDIELRATVAKVVRIDDFSLLHHRLLYATIIGAGDAPFFDICHKLEDQPIFQEVGGEQYILDLMAFVENFAEGLHFAQRVAQLGQQRRVLRLAESVAKAAIAGKLKGLSKAIARGLRYALLSPTGLRSVGQQMPLPGLLPESQEELASQPLNL